MHKAKAVVVTCMDFRFHNNVQQFLLDKGYLGHCDEIVIAGASRDFIHPIEEDHGKYVWRQLELSMKLHDPDKIIIIDHQDCGGYAQDGLIKGGQDKEVDMVEHKKIQQNLLKMIKEKFPTKEVEFYYTALDGTIEGVNFN